MDEELEDLKEMERSAIREFVDPGQLSVLLDLWLRGERKDNESFAREFCGEGEDD